MKRVSYNLYFDNQFTRKNYHHTLWFPFWWSNKRIVAWVLGRCEYNNCSICWVKIFGKIVWEHTFFRDKDYKGIQEKRKELLANFFNNNA